MKHPVALVQQPLAQRLRLATSVDGRLKVPAKVLVAELATLGLETLVCRPPVAVDNGLAQASG